jgi:hypothetical protein
VKSREEIITDMCYTYRHDYGLDKLPSDPPWTAGMTPDERKGLYNTMSQIYEHNIEPLLNQYKELDEGNSVVLPKDKEHAEAMVKVGMFYLEQQNGKSFRIL